MEEEIEERLNRKKRDKLERLFIGCIRDVQASRKHVQYISEKQQVRWLKVLASLETQLKIHLKDYREVVKAKEGEEAGEEEIV